MYSVVGQLKKKSKIQIFLSNQKLRKLSFYSESKIKSSSRNIIRGLTEFKKYSCHCFIRILLLYMVNLVNFNDKFQISFIFVKDLF